jgi:hypothetical protein
LRAQYHQKQERKQISRNLGVLLFSFDPFLTVNFVFIFSIVLFTY